MSSDSPGVRVDHLSPDEAFRVRMTVSCRDADDIPKVEGAGEVRERDGVPVQVMHNGVVVEEGCYYGPWMTEIIRSLRGHHEPQEELVFHQMLERLAETEPETTMVELGSFWAYYSLWLLERLPDARVVAMEPDPNYLEVGRRNFALNSREGTFVHGAIGAEPGGDTSFTAESTGRQVVVPQHDLASLLAATDVQRVGILMVDIQGAETFLLERARGDFAAGRVRFMIVSTHHRSISGDPLTHQRALQLLQEEGGHVIADHTVAESFSGDGLIAVSFDQRDRDLHVPISHARAKDSLFGEPELDLNHALHERDEARLAAAAHEARVRELEAELTAVRSSRTWVWSRAPRSLYRRLRARRRRPG